MALFFTIRFFICHVSCIRIKTGGNGRILDWRGAGPKKNSNVTFNTHGLFHTSIGFGFDPKTNDYKVVRILSTLRSRCDGFGKSRPMVVEVYSLPTGEWRMLSASASLPPMCGILSHGP